MRGHAWSTTSWRTSTSSSTSDLVGPEGSRRAGRRRRAGEFADRLRLVHPFPSVLNGFASFALALVAGGGPAIALRLGLAMTAIQFSIGALNDLVDAPRDGGRTPVKPLADGLLSHRSALAITVVAASAGFALAATFGVATLLVTAGGAACGYAYDLWLSRTAWAWLPLALALPLVPVYAWVGTTGSVPAWALALVPIAMLAGGGLAIGNALADLDADGSADTRSVAVRLGRRTAWRLHALALGAAAGLAVATLPASPAAWGVALVLVGILVLALGVVGIASVASPARLARARLGWQVEAIGVALLGIGWVLASAAGVAGAAGAA